MAHDFMIRVKEGIWKKNTKMIDKGMIDGVYYYKESSR